MLDVVDQLIHRDMDGLQQLVDGVLARHRVCKDGFAKRHVENAGVVCVGPHDLLALRDHRRGPGWERRPAWRPVMLLSGGRFCFFMMITILAVFSGVLRIFVLMAVTVLPLCATGEDDCVVISHAVAHEIRQEPRVGSDDVGRAEHHLRHDAPDGRRGALADAETVPGDLDQLAHERVLFL